MSRVQNSELVPVDASEFDNRAKKLKLQIFSFFCFKNLTHFAAVLYSAPLNFGGNTYAKEGSPVRKMALVVV